MLVRSIILCDYSNDSTDGKLNAFGITDSIYAHSFPARHKTCHLIVSFELQQSDFGSIKNSEVRLIDPDGRRLLETKTPIECVPTAPIVNHRHIIHDLELAVAGAYEFTVFIDGVEAGKRSFEAVRLPATG